MSSVLPAPSTAGFAPREGLGGAFAGFSRRHWLLILCFAVITPLLEMLFAVAYGEPVHTGPVFGGIAKYVVIGFTTVCFAIAADNLLRHRLGPIASLVIVFLAASVVSAALIEFIVYAVVAPLGWDDA